MEEIKVKEYIRTFDGDIDRIILKNNIEGDRKLIVFEKRNYYLSDIGLNKIVKKHSPNIIDLIEVGDYVNGQLVDEKWYDYANKEMRFYNNGNFIGLEGYIKSIVTREQFENVEYRLED